MKKRISSILCVLLAMLMLVTALASCNNRENPSGNTNTGVPVIDTNTNRQEPETSGSAAGNTGLELRDFNNGVMNVWYSFGKSTWSPYPLQVSDEEAVSGDIVYKAGYDRNKKMEHDFNLSVMYKVSETNPNATNETGETAALRNLKQGGDDAKYDMMLVGATPVSTLAAEGYWYDLSHSDYIKPDAYYYETQMNQQVRLMKHQYFASGFYSVKNTAAVDCTYVNTDILSSINQEVTLQDLYDLAMDHKWTLSTMLTLGAPYATPDDNKGTNYKATLENVTNDGNKYSLILSRNYCMNMYYDLGGSIIEWDDNAQKYNVTVHSVEGQNFFSWIQNNLTANPNVGMIVSDKHTQAFMANAAPFMVVTLNNLFTLKGSGMNYSILPTPLMNEGDDYRAYSAAWNLNFAAIPAQCTDLDKASYLYEMFMAYSYDFVYPAYYEQTFGVTYAPDATASQIFDLMAHSRVVCLANIYGLFGTRQTLHIVMSTQNGVASTTETIQTEVEANLAELLKKLK